MKVLLAVVVAIMIVSIHLECESTTIKNMVPKNRPAKSKWPCHDWVGQDHGWRVMGGCLFLTFWHAIQLSTSDSISLSIPDHYT